MYHLNLCLAQKQNRVFDMAGVLPAQHAKGNDAGRIAKLVGLITGFVPNCSLKDFPLEPEMAIKKQPAFLSVWFAEKPTKPEARLSFQTACPQVPHLERNEIIQHLGLYQAWLKKKSKNLKNGEKTCPAVLQVMKAMGLAPAGNESKPARRLKEKTKSDQATSEPAMAAPKLAEAQRPAMVAHSQAEHPQPDQHQELEKAAAKKSKILVLQNSSPKLSGESDRSASEEKDVSVVSTQEISSTSSGMVTPQKLHPKDGKTAGCKRPASCVTPRKKPAMAPKSAKTSKPAKAAHMATHNTWVASCSFGWLKMGSFKEKGYIQARNGSDSKPYCLVNVNLPKGDDQTKVLEACFAEAQKPDLDKAHMVNFKNHVLKQL